MGTYNEIIEQIGRECGLDIHDGTAVLIGGSPNGSRSDDMRNIASDMRRVLNRYIDGETC